jgi:hypothetical protein
MFDKGKTLLLCILGIVVLSIVLHPPIIYLYLSITRHLWRIITAEQFLKLISILIWPLVALLIAISFKRIIASVFFSVDEFNFFGIKGELKSVYTVVEQQAQLLYQKRVDDEQRESEERERQKKLKKIKESKDSLNDKYENVEKIAEEQSVKINDLEKLLAEERNQREKDRGEMDKKTQETIDWMFQNFEIHRKPKVPQIGEKIEEKKL